MVTESSGRETRRRAGVTLALVVLAAVVIVSLVGVFVARYVTRPDTGTPTQGGSAGPVSPSLPGRGRALSAEEWLAVRPMLQLPTQAAQPQPMTPDTAGPSIALPRPAITSGTWIQGGFPATPEGALAQLTALNETALEGGDPQVYGNGYRALSLPGAPDPQVTGLSTLLTAMRARGSLPATGPVTGMRITYDVSQGQIKGTGEDGIYVVGCVLGQLTIDYNGRLLAAGVGDCQALRWSGQAWRIAAGPLASAAPCAWPGSADAVKAGYRAVTR